MIQLGGNVVSKEDKITQSNFLLQSHAGLSEGFLEQDLSWNKSWLHHLLIV